MYKLMTKHGQLIAFSLGLLVVLIYLGAVLSGLEAFEMLPKEEKSSTSIFNPGLMVTMVLIVVGLIAWVAFSIYHIVDNLRASLIGLISFGALIIVFLIAYSMADPVSSGSLAQTIEDKQISETASSLISGGLTTVAVLVIAALGAFVYGEISNLFK